MSLQFLPSLLREGNSPVVPKPCCCPPSSLCPSLGGSREKPVSKLHKSCLPHTSDAGGRDRNDRELNLRNKREGNKAGKFDALMHSQPSACDATRRKQILTHFESRFLPWMGRRLEKLKVISLKVPARLTFSYSERCEVSYGSQEELTPQFTTLRLLSSIGRVQFSRKDQISK